MNQKKLEKYLQLDEMINTTIKTGLGCIKRRLENIITSSNETENRIKSIEREIKETKDIVKLHSEYSDRYFDREKLLKILEIPYSPTTDRLAILRQQLENKYITHVKHNNFQSGTIQPPNTTNHIEKTPDVLALQKNYNKRGNKSEDYYILPRVNIEKSQAILRIKPRHCLNQKTVTNKICLSCLKKENPMNKSKDVYECKVCGIFLHERCKDSIKGKICIPLGKVTSKLVEQKEFHLKDLCQNYKFPMVPSALLILMHYSQTSDMICTDVYADIKMNKKIKEVCSQLFEGKLNCIASCSLQILGNCIKFILRNLKSPLLSENTIVELMKIVGNSREDFERVLYQAMATMSQDNLDTFVYLMIHLKLVVESNLPLNYESLAMNFAPCITGNEISNRLVIDVIIVMMQLPFKFYKGFLNENLFFHHFFKMV